MRRDQGESIISSNAMLISNPKVFDSPRRLKNTLSDSYKAEQGIIHHEHIQGSRMSFRTAEVYVRNLFSSVTSSTVLLCSSYWLIP